MMIIMMMVTTSPAIIMGMMSDVDVVPRGPCEAVTRGGADGWG